MSKGSNGEFSQNQWVNEVSERVDIESRDEIESELMDGRMIKTATLSRKMPQSPIIEDQRTRDETSQSPNEKHNISYEHENDFEDRLSKNKSLKNDQEKEIKDIYDEDAAGYDSDDFDDTDSIAHGNDDKNHPTDIISLKISNPENNDSNNSNIESKNSNSNEILNENLGKDLVNDLKTDHETFENEIKIKPPSVKSFVKEPDMPSNKEVTSGNESERQLSNTNSRNNSIHSDVQYSSPIQKSPELPDDQKSLDEILEVPSEETLTINPNIKIVGN